ncbi:hypothetical protein ACFQJD_10310 [Haloplanus sp. GCM10025708]|uniref:hypothetical protein n=1 Tax=Haloferacaceae TaxID=1644056 RepID=UPI00360E7772
MNPFRKLGRQVERFKSNAEEAAGERPRYQCTECEARFDEAHPRCPECDAANVVSIDDKAES